MRGGVGRGENVTGRSGLNDLKLPLAGGNVYTTGGLCKWHFV